MVVRLFKSKIVHFHWADECARANTRDGTKVFLPNSWPPLHLREVGKRDTDRVDFGPGRPATHNPAIKGSRNFIQSSAFYIYNRPVYSNGAPSYNSFVPTTINLPSLIVKLHVYNIVCKIILFIQRRTACSKSEIYTRPYLLQCRTCYKSVFDFCEYERSSLKYDNIRKIRYFYTIRCICLTKWV